VTVDIYQRVTESKLNFGHVGRMNNN